jgi:hypothetical protein
MTAQGYVRAGGGGARRKYLRIIKFTSRNLFWIALLPPGPHISLCSPPSRDATSVPCLISQSPQESILLCLYWQTTCSSKILSDTFSHLMICPTKRHFETICSSRRFVRLLMWKRLISRISLFSRLIKTRVPFGFTRVHYFTCVPFVFTRVPFVFIRVLARVEFQIRS